MRQNFHQNPSNSKFWWKFWRIWHGRQNRKISKRWKNRVWWSLMKFVLEQTFHQNNCACQNDFYCFDAFGCIFIKFFFNHHCVECKTHKMECFSNVFRVRLFKWQQYIHNKERMKIRLIVGLKSCKNHDVFQWKWERYHSEWRYV